MQNLEQIRAAHALQKAPTLDKQVVSKLPAMILNNGLLAAAAFARDGNREGMRDAMDAVADYLIAHKLAPHKVRGYGHAIPVADDTNEHGRHQNRRVELWIQ